MGVGRGRPRAAVRRRHARLARGRARRAGGAAGGARALEDVVARREPACGRAARALRRDRARRPRGARRARARQVLSRPRAPARRGLPRRARRRPLARAITTRCGRSSRRAPARASPSCRSAAARASSVASSPCAAASRRSSRSTSARSTRSSSSTSARRWPSRAAACAPPSSRPGLPSAVCSSATGPQSFEYVSIGGCVATRSAGQASTGYGRIDELVVGATLAAPAATSSCPRRRQRRGARPAAACRRLGGVARCDHGGGPARAPAARGGALRGLDAAVVRGGRGGAAAAGAGGPGARRRAAVGRARDADGRSGWRAMGRSRRAALEGYLRVRGVREGVLAILGWEGSEDRVGALRDAATELLREGGAVALGRAPGRAWARSRFQGPYLRDDLMARGVLVDTIETATTWSELFSVYRAVGAALRGARADRRLSHLAPVSDWRVAVLHGHGAGAAGRRARAVGAAQAGGERGDRGVGRDDQPPPRGRRRPRALSGRRGRATPGWPRCARSSASSIPPG